MLKHFVLLKTFEHGWQAKQFVLILRQRLANSKSFLGAWTWAQSTMKLPDHDEHFEGPVILENGYRDVACYRDKCRNGEGDVYTYREMKDWIEGGFCGEPPSPPNEDDEQRTLGDLGGYVTLVHKNEVKDTEVLNFTNIHKVTGEQA